MLTILGGLDPDTDNASAPAPRVQRPGFAPKSINLMTSSFYKYGRPVWHIRSMLHVHERR